MESVFANSSEETKVLAMAFLTDQPRMMTSMLKQIAQAKMMMGEDAQLPPEMQVQREHLMSLRASGNYLGKADEGLKKEFDQNFQKGADNEPCVGRP